MANNTNRLAWGSAVYHRPDPETDCPDLTINLDQYGPDAVECGYCGKRTYGDKEAFFCVHCGSHLPESTDGPH